MKSIQELNTKICSCTDALTAKLDGSNGKRAILLCGGTGCLSSNSMEIKEKFEKLVAENGMQDKIVADSAEPKSIAELYSLGCNRITKARKGNDSIRWGINLIQQFHIYVHPNCKNFITELSNYRWKKDKAGNFTNEPERDFDHLMDALRYAVMAISRSAVYSFK